MQMVIIENLKNPIVYPHHGGPSHERRAYGPCGRRAYFCGDCNKQNGLANAFVNCLAVETVCTIALATVEWVKPEDYDDDDDDDDDYNDACKN